MKNCHIAFPQIRGYIISAKGGGAYWKDGSKSKGSLINLLFWFRCGWSLINYRWSGKRKCFSWYSYQLRKWGRRREGGGRRGGGFEGAPEGGHLFGGGRFLERGCLFIEILKCCIPNRVEVRSDKRVAEKLEGVKTWQTMNWSYEKVVKKRRRASEKQNMLSREDKSMNIECLI